MLTCLPSSFLIHCRGGISASNSAKICQVFVSVEEVNNATLAAIGASQKVQEEVRNCAAPLPDEDGISEKVLRIG